MQKKSWALVTLLALAYLFRGSLLAMLPFQREGVNGLAMLLALLIGLFFSLVAYVIVTTLELQRSGSVVAVIIALSMMAVILGEWLGKFALIGHFWGVFITGFVESGVLTGALAGAKEVWSCKKDK